MSSRLRIALVHDWLTGMRGGESVLEAIAELAPDATLFTLIRLEDRISPQLARLPAQTSFLQKIPGAGEKYRHFLPLMPKLIERFDLSGYDLILSSSHCVAKGVRKPPGAVHVSYVHAPMRYMWDRFDDYFGPGRSSAPVRLAARTLRPRMQSWDRKVSSQERIDLLVANSRFIAEQIRLAYDRDARVVLPFAEIERFSSPRRPGSEYLMVGAFAPNKRVDLAIEAFNRLRLPLLIVGKGQEEQKLRRLAGPTIRFAGALSNEEIAAHYATCKAFVFPGLEDAGITPMEAMAAGAPVIAYGAGGALETVTPETGIFFHPQTVEALVSAIQEFESRPGLFAEGACRQRGRMFSRDRFQREYSEALRATWRGAGKDPELLEDSLKLPS